MKSGLTRTAQNAKKGQSPSQPTFPDPDMLAKYFMCLDGAGEAWRSLMEENTAARDSERSNKRRKMLDRIHT